MHKTITAFLITVLAFFHLCGCRKESSDLVSKSQGMTQVPIIYRTLTRYDISNQTLTVVTNDPYNENDLILSVTEPRGLKADRTSILTYGSGPVTASFKWTASDPVKGGNGNTTVTVTDSEGNYSTLSVLIHIPGSTDAINSAPVIDTSQTVYNQGTRILSVLAYDTDKADILTLKVTRPGGLVSDKDSEVVSGPGPYRTDFKWSAVNVLSGATGKTVLTVTDNKGLADEHSIEIHIPGTNTPPRIDHNLTAFDTSSRTLNIAVSDQDENDRITVKVTEPSGLNVDITEKNTLLNNSSKNMKFYWSPTGILSDGSGITSILVTDGIGATDTYTTEVKIPGFTLEHDSLYAVPVETNTTTDTPVTIIVASGYPAGNFHTMKNVRLTVNQDSRIEPDSFNAGAPGGTPTDIDGFWTAVSPAGPFLIPPSGFINETDLADYKTGFDFTLMPIDAGNATNARGMLFNFKMKFLSPGEYTLGFQTYFGQKRTFYTDKEGNEYYWGKNYNQYPGVPNTITVR